MDRLTVVIGMLHVEAGAKFDFRLSEPGTKKQDAVIGGTIWVNLILKSKR